MPAPDRPPRSHWDRVSVMHWRTPHRRFTATDWLLLALLAAVVIAGAIYLLGIV